MAIEDRNLRPGQKLVATYKQQTFVCEVMETEEGVRYRVDGKDHKSPSAAGSAVLGGMACNGWRFWSLEGEAPAPRGRKPQEAGEGPAPAKSKRSKVFKKAKNQKGVPEGQVRWLCQACADHFEGDPAPKACPAGHLAETDGNGDLQQAQPVTTDPEPETEPEGEAVSA